MCVRKDPSSSEGSLLRKTEVSLVEGPLLLPAASTPAWLALLARGPSASLAFFGQFTFSVSPLSHKYVPSARK